MRLLNVPERDDNMITVDYRPVLAYLRAEALADPKIAALLPPQREAMVFSQILEQLPIGKIPETLLAGDYGLVFAEDALKEKVAAWHPIPPQKASGGDDPFDCLSRQYYSRAGFSPAHSSAAYELVLQLGLEGMIAGMTTAAPEDEEYLQAEIITLRAVCAWSERYADLGFEACRQVPARPPRNFAEAVQAVWLVHTVIGIGEKCDASLSLGRLDQYLYPFYRADLASGVPEARLEAVLTDLLLKLNRYGDAACAVNLGGLTADGRDMFNDLTRLIVKVAVQLQLPSPILAARVHPGLGQEDFDSLTVPELFGIGQPSFYGEVSCRQALLQRGVPQAEVHRWAVNSCMGLIMPGEEFSDMWALVFTFLLPLELALNGGRPLRGELPFTLKTVAPSEYENAAAVMWTLEAYAEELLALLIKRHREINRREGLDNPDPYLSALLGGGIPGRDRLLGGPRYHTANVDAFALVNAADALTALDRVVFRDHRRSLAEVVVAVKNNFVGEEALRLELLAAPKYGNGEDEADRMVAALAGSFAAMVRRHSTPELIYMPSFHTLNGHVNAGQNWGASADGRLAGEPFAKNIGPMQGRNRNGLTALLQSASTIDQEYFYGGQALDLHLDAEIVADKADARKFQAALQTYFQLGGLLAQVNGVKAATLKKALLKPEDYGDLTVRIGGYSARFVTLAPEVQREMIRRFECHT